MHVVGRAVERIDDPAEAGARVARLPGGERRPGGIPFLAHEAVVRKRVEQDAPHLPLGGVVGFGDQIPRPLRRCPKAAHPFPKHPATGSGGSLADDERVGAGGHQARLHNGMG